MRIELFYDKKESSTKFSLLEDATVTIGNQGFSIPLGFVSDGGSIPRFAWSWASPLDGRFIGIYTLHDYIYTTGILSRDDADRILRDGLIEAGMSRSQAYTIWSAVRMFGKSHYLCK